MCKTLKLWEVLQTMKNTKTKDPITMNKSDETFVTFRKKYVCNLNVKHI